MEKLLAQICRGRLSKGAYWKHISLLSIVIFILLLFVGHYSEGDDFWPNNIRIGVFMFFLIVYISVQCAIIFTPHLAIRRLHDVGFSGWKLFRDLFLYQFLCVGVAGYTDLLAVRALLGVISFIIVITFIRTLLEKGQQSSNKWGDNPNDKYVGDLKNGKKQGKGTYTFANGEEYIGEFKNDMFHGKGIYTWPDGSTEEGLWENDDFIKE